MIIPRSTAPFVAYLISSFQESSNGITQYLSNGNDAYNFTPLNQGQPILTSNVGTLGSRDPFLLQNSLTNDAFILATDLDISRTTWKEAQVHGSRDIVVWHSTDLINWDDAFLLILEDSNAGYVWAPSALYSEADNLYFIFYSCRLYAQDDPDHTGPHRTAIRYITTSDFQTISPPQDYIYDSSTAVIDQEIVPLDDGEFMRFLKDEVKGYVYREISSGGPFGNWTSVGMTIDGVEGPTVFRDNIDVNKYHLWVDLLSSDQQSAGYDAYETIDLTSGQLTASPPLPFNNIRHDSVTPLTQQQYDGIVAKFSPA